MPATDPVTGLTVYIPGVYTSSKLVSEPAGGVPDFLIPLLLGEAFCGYPYNANSLKYSSEADIPFYTKQINAEDTATVFGRGSKLHALMKYAKRGGLPLGFNVCMSALTRASVLVTSTGPVNEFTLYSKSFGAIGSHIGIKWASSIMTIVPIRHHCLLSANIASTGTRAYVKGEGDDPTAWIGIGSTLYIGDNNSTNTTVVVSNKGYEINSSGQKQYWVDFAAAPGTAYATADYAVIFAYDTANTKTSPAYSAGQGQALVDWINTTGVVGAHKHANFSGVLPIAVSSQTPLKEISAWSTVTAGTSPAATSTDHTNFVAQLIASGWSEFQIAEGGALPMLFAVGDSSSTIHATWRDYAITAYQQHVYTQIVTGCRFTDTATGASDDTNPGYRALTLGNQDVRLCAGQLDFLDPCLSVAGQLVGKICSGQVGHDCTHDDLLSEAIGRNWSATELEYLLRKGVTTYTYDTNKTGAMGLVIAQDVNTYPGGRDGNVIDGNPVVTGYGVMRIQMLYAEHLAKAYKRFIGNSRVTKAQLVGFILNFFDEKLYRRGLTTEPTRIQSITPLANGTGWNVEPAITFRGVSHFFTVTVNISI